MSRRSTLVLLGSMTLCACFARPFDPQSLVQTLRVVALRADHSTPAPGSDVKLEMLMWDGSPKATLADGSKRPVSIVWLGGCFDPPGDLYYQCYPTLGAQLDALRTGTPSPNVGSGTTYTLHVPADLISRRKGSRAALPYGISFVFYAACAGKVVALPFDPSAPPATPPLGCVADDGSEVSTDGFVFGYLSLYSYPGIDNQNPVVTTGLFNGRMDVPKACATDGDCAPGDACSASKSCIPVVPVCSSARGATCTQYTVKPTVDPTNAEPDPVATLRAGASRSERLYVQYFASHGTLANDSGTIVDPVHGSNDIYDTAWSPPTVVGETRIWSIVKDNRGGVGWWWQDVMVR